MFGLLGVAFAAWKRRPPSRSPRSSERLSGAPGEDLPGGLGAILTAPAYRDAGLRQHYQVPLRTTGNLPMYAWVLSNYEDWPETGQVLSQRALNQLFQQAPASVNVTRNALTNRPT